MTLSKRFKINLSYPQRLRLLLPFALGMVVLYLLPASISFGLAFFKYHALSPPRWVGHLNFILVFTDELFTLSVRNSLALILLPVPLRVFGDFLLANFMKGDGRFLGWLRGLVFLPSVIPSAVFALGWLWILNPLNDPLNMLLTACLSQRWIKVLPGPLLSMPTQSWGRPSLPAVGGLYPP
jgi:multiple sugar transport system permease protein